MSDQARRLTKRGIDTFRRYLEDLRNGGTAAPPRDLLTDLQSSESLERDVTLTERGFENRLDAARYLAEVLGGIPSAGADAGLWAWLSLYYFDQVCPGRADGTRAPGRDYRHIPEPGFPYGHRHLLAGPCAVYLLHAERARLLLCTSVPLESRFHHELASRQALISNSAVIDAADLLYFDPERGRPKRGAHGAGRDPGTLLRFVDILMQLDVNYDLYSMTAEGILALLPAEFDRWKGV